MKEWFTIEKIDLDTYAICENKHWEETNCYLVCGNEKAVLIDTGLGVANIKEVADSLTDLPVQVLTTHVHWDHIGGHKYFENIAVHKEEEKWISGDFPLPISVVLYNLMQKPCEFPKEFRKENYEIFQRKPQQILENEEWIDLGNRRLQVIHTPGHSPGHCCFYEPERKYLYSGDLIYKGCLYAFYPTTNPELFWKSVKKVSALEVEKILPGHHDLNIPVDIINKIDIAFQKLKEEVDLVQGKGYFDFGEFQIHI